MCCSYFECISFWLRIEEIELNFVISSGYGFVAKWVSIFVFEC